MLTDHSEKSIWLSGFPIDDKRVNRIILVAQDISKRKKLEKRLLQAEKMKSIGLLAGGVAHELNNILLGLVSYPDYLLLSMDVTDPLRKDILEIKKSGQKAADLVQDLLTLSRKDVSKLEKVSLKDILEHFIRSKEVNTFKKEYPHIELKFNYPNISDEIRGNKKQLIKSLLNIILNSAGGIDSNGEIEISLQKKKFNKDFEGYELISAGEYGVISIKDNGNQLSEENRRRIFEPFYTHRVLKRNNISGIGLAMVWGTIKEHEGFLNVYTQNSKNIYEIYIPIYDEVISKQETKFTKKEAHEISNEIPLILIVDDDAMQRKITSKILKRLGYEYISAESGETALEILKNGERPDLILLDMIMEPGMDGYDTYKKIHEIDPNLKTILISGYAETERVNKALKLGADNFVKKPYSVEELTIIIKNELEESS